MNHDLTVGDSSKVLWRFCIPLFGSVIFQQLYNIADSFVVGKFVSQDALAAVGNSYEVTLIFIAFAFGCNIGCSVIVSRFFGEKAYDKLKTAVSTSLLAGGVLCGVLVLLGLLFCGEILNMINTPAEVFADSKLYLDIYIMGFPFVLFYNIATGIFSALGDSKTPFIFLVCSSLSNIGVDIFFVTVLNMGVAGVAWATFLCQGVSCVLALCVVLKRLKEIQTPEKPRLFSGIILKQVAVVAIPSILQQSFISVGNILIQGIINTFGTEVMAGYAAAIKLNSLVISPMTTLGNGVSNFTAQNMGANKVERVPEGFRAGVKMVWMLSIPLSLLYVFGGRYLVLLFMENPTALALETGARILRTLAPFYCIVAAKQVADGVLRGAGMMRRFMAATFSGLLLRVVLAKFLSAYGSNSIWWAWPIGWVLAAIISVTFYSQGVWGKKGKAEK